MPEPTSVIAEETQRAGVWRSRRLTLVQQWVADGKIPTSYQLAADNYAEAFDRAHLNGDYQTVNLEGVGRGPGDGVRSWIKSRQLKISSIDATRLWAMKHQLSCGMLSAAT